MCHSKHIAGRDLGRQRRGERAYICSVGEVANIGQLLLVGLHQQLNGSLPDLQSGHVGQKVIADEEAHEHCKAVRDCYDVPSTYQCV